MGGNWITAEKHGVLRKLCVPRDGPFQVVKHIMEWLHLKKNLLKMTKSIKEEFGLIPGDLVLLLEVKAILEGT